MISALFLDFDGVICDTERAAWRSWDELYRRFGLAFPGEVWAAMAGHPGGHEVAAADLSARIGRPLEAAELDRRLRRKQDLAGEEPVRPGISGILGAARLRGLFLAVVSSSSETWVCGHLDRLGLREAFDLVVTGDGRLPSKPAPDLYLRALDRSGLAPGSVVVLEDSAPGVAAATAAGLRCVAVPNSVTDPSVLAAADLVLDLAEVDRAAVDLFEVIS